MATKLSSATHTLAPNRVYLGDARQLAPRLADRSITVTLTSPPYWSLKDYGARNQIGRGQSYQDYMRDLASIFTHVYRATRDTGSLWVVLDTFKIAGRAKLLPFEFSSVLEEESGWILQDVIIWDKGKTLPWSGTGRLRNQFEYLLAFSKNKKFKYEIDRLKEIDLKEWWVRYPERYNPSGKVPSNIWSVPIPVQGCWSTNGLRHACPFPLSLVEKVLLLTTDASTDQVVFDPFAGSGIVLALAEQMGRGYLGFEVNSTFISMYRSKVRTYVSSEWNSRSHARRTLEGRRKALQQQILRLRITKYPLALFKRLRKQMGSASPIVRGILAISPSVPAFPIDQTKVHHLTSLRVFLIVDSVSNRTTLTRALDHLITVRPLSKFGIAADVSFLTIREIEQLEPRFGLSEDQQLWIYRNGRTYKFHGRTTLLRWLETLSAHSPKNGNATPLIASNIQVSQTIVRTWFPKKEGIQSELVDEQIVEE